MSDELAKKAQRVEVKRVERKTDQFSAFFTSVDESAVQWSRQRMTTTFEMPIELRLEMQSPKPIIDAVFVVKESS